MTPILAQRPRADRAFERMYRRHLADVYRYSLAVMRNQADAEDVTQTTFMNAYRAFQRGERPEKPQNWLIAIAHNVCRQRFRQSARRPTEVSFDEDIGNRLVAVEEDESPTAEDIQRALGYLAFNQRAALVMRELEGRSYAEIGEILELSPSAVETVIFRARRALREQLESRLSCGEAELAISQQLDGRLPRKEKGALRAHLRECKECATFARRQRAHRSALRSLAAIPVPTSLTSLFGGGGGGALGTGIALKAAAAVTAGAVLGGAGYEGVQQVIVRHPAHHVARSAPAPQRHARPHAAPARESRRTHAAGPSVAAAPTRARRHTAPAAADRSAAPAGPTKQDVAEAGDPDVSVHGDASVAARHTDGKPVHPAKDDQPAKQTGDAMQTAHEQHARPPKPVKEARQADEPKHATKTTSTDSTTTVPKAKAPPPSETVPSPPTTPVATLPGPYDGGPPPREGHGKP